MRLVYFENDAGERINLNRIPGQTPTRGIIATNLTGLGYTPGSSYSKVSAGYYRQTGENEKMQPCGLTLNFTQNAYTNYKWLLDWMIDAGEWDYVYNPGDGEYRRRVTLEYINKPEKNKVGHLVSQMSLVTLTPWYTVETITATGTASIGAGGQIGTSVKVRTTSALTNPVLTMTDADGEFQRLSLTVTKASGTVFEYSNHYYDSHIYIGTADGIQYADLSTAIFGHSRKAFTLALSGASMTIEVKRWWRTI